MSFRIRDWREHFENNRTRELKRMDWVPVPNRMDGVGYTELVDHPNGAAHLGAWLAIVEISSRQSQRGTIPQDDAEIPHLLARISRLPATIFTEVIPRLVKIGWIEPTQSHKNNTVIEIPQDDAEIPQDDAEIPQDDAALRARDHGRALLRNGRERKGTEGNITSEREAEEICEAFDRHLKHDRKEPRDLTIQSVMSMNGGFDWERFRERHAAYCEHYAAHGWDYCTLSFLGWIRAGMPPAPKTKSAGQEAAKVSICPNCETKPCVCYARHLAKHGPPIPPNVKPKTL